MTFVTRLTLQSGDRAVLDGEVEAIQRTVERKGAELKGPHSDPPVSTRVPQYKSLERDGEEFPAWDYTVYTRELEIVGHDEVARRIAHREFPAGVHVQAEVEQIHRLQ